MKQFGQAVTKVLYGANIIFIEKRRSFPPSLQKLTLL